MTWHQLSQDKGIVMASILDEMRADANALRMSLAHAALANRGFQALTAYRVAKRLHSRSAPILPLAVTRVIQVLYGIDIGWRAEISGGVVIRHGVGVVIGHDVVIGSGCVIYQGVTLGYLGDRRRPGTPRLGQNVLLGAGAVILGAI